MQSTSNEKRLIPVTLHVLDDEPTRQAGGGGLPYIRIEADARTTYRDLHKLLIEPSLITNGVWPEGLERDEIQQAIDNLIAGEYPGERPFPELSPSNVPAKGYCVRCHPTISNMYLVIDPLVEIDSSWETSDEAYCAVWDLAVEQGDVEASEPLYGYIGIEVPEPEGYQITFHHPGDDVKPAAGAAPAWYFETENMGSEDYESEFQARIAAWRDKLGQARAEVRSVRAGTTQSSLLAELYVDQAAEAVILMQHAADLFGDGAGRELGDNPEYERGIAELICARVGVPMDSAHELIAEIHALAGGNVTTDNGRGLSPLRQRIAEALKDLEPLIDWLEKQSQPGERWPALCAKSVLAKLNGEAYTSNQG